MKRGFPSAGYHTRLLCPESPRDTTRATFQMRPCPARSRRSGQRSNTTDASVASARQARGRPLAQEHLGFHPASGYKYSGEPGVCKVTFWTCRGPKSEPAITSRSTNEERRMNHEVRMTQMFAALSP